MARLSELQEGYSQSAIKIRLAIEELRPKVIAGDLAAKYKVKILKEMLQEMRDLRQLVVSYYTAPQSPKYTMNGLYAPRVQSDKT